MKFDFDLESIKAFIKYQLPFSRHTSISKLKQVLASFSDSVMI